MSHSPDHARIAPTTGDLSPQACSKLQLIKVKFQIQLLTILARFQLISDCCARQHRLGHCHHLGYCSHAQGPRVVTLPVHLSPTQSLSAGRQRCSLKCSLAHITFILRLSYLLQQPGKKMQVPSGTDWHREAEARGGLVGPKHLQRMTMGIWIVS